MPTAPLKDQRKLVELQSRDTVLSRLSHELRTLPVLQELATLAQQKQQIEQTLVAARTRASDISREVQRGEAEIEAVRTRAERHAARLAAGTAPAKELAALERELANVRQRQAALEGGQLEVLERLEAAQENVATIAEQMAAVEEEIAEAAQRRDAAAQEIKGRGKQLLKERNEFAATIPAFLVAEYDRVRRAHGGVAVAALYGRRVEGAPLDLTPAEYDRIRSAAPEEVLFSEDEGYLIVRMAEQ